MTGRCEAAGMLKAYTCMILEALMAIIMNRFGKVSLNAGLLTVTNFLYNEGWAC